MLTHVHVRIRHTQIPAGNDETVVCAAMSTFAKCLASVPNPGSDNTMSAATELLESTQRQYQGCKISVGASVNAKGGQLTFISQNEAEFRSRRSQTGMFSMVDDLDTAALKLQTMKVANAATLSKIAADAATLSDALDTMVDLAKQSLDTNAGVDATVAKLLQERTEKLNALLEGVHTPVDPLDDAHVYWLALNRHVLGIGQPSVSVVTLGFGMQRKCATRWGEKGRVRSTDLCVHGLCVA